MVRAIDCKMFSLRLCLVLHVICLNLVLCRDTGYKCGEITCDNVTSSDTVRENEALFGQSIAYRPHSKHGNAIWSRLKKQFKSFEGIRLTLKKALFVLRKIWNSDRISRSSPIKNHLLDNGISEQFHVQDSLQNEGYPNPQTDNYLFILDDKFSLKTIEATWTETRARLIVLQIFHRVHFHIYRTKGLPSIYIEPVNHIELSFWSCYVTARTFGIRRRMQLLLMLPISFKLGVIVTLLLVLTVMSLKGLIIGFLILLLILANTHTYSKLWGSSRTSELSESFHKNAPVHIHVHTLLADDFQHRPYIEHPNSWPVHPSGYVYQASNWNEPPTSAVQVLNQQPS